MGVLGLSFDGMMLLLWLIVVSTAVVKWRGLRGLVAIPAAIVLTFGEQIGFFAGISPGSWPSNATGAVFFGVLSDHGLRLVVVAYAIFLGLMLLADRCGSRPLWHMLALVRTVVAKNKMLSLWTLGVSSLLTSVFLDWRVVAVVSLSLMTVFLIARLIGAIKSPMRQASALASVALLMGLCLGFYLPDERPDEFDCGGDRELVLRSGERLACVTSKMFMRRKFMVVQGPAASTLVWPTDVEPASLRRTFSPAAAEYLARLAK